MEDQKRRELKKLALEIRIGIIEQLKARGFGHVGGSLSIADALAVLYGDVMRVRPEDPKWPDRDKLVCSKGHAGPAIYATLAVKGFFPYEELKTLNQPGTKFPSHCDRKLTPGVDMTTGSLGQGTSVACGMALADKLLGKDCKTYLFVGDGELDEGQVWEAAMFAAGKQLDNVVWLIDWNKKQLDGTLDEVLPQFDIRAKFASFGFDAVLINGNDIDQVYDAVVNAGKQGKPTAIILDTVKGCGVKEVEETVANHSMTVPTEKWDSWLCDLKAELEQMEA